jgi:hypothetical protein
MRKTRWLLLGSLLACIVGLVLVVLALLPPRPGVTKENFDRIHNGMTRAEVEAIFGDESGRHKDQVALWVSDDAADLALVAFDNEDRVLVKNWLGQPDDRTPFEKLLDRLPWRAKPNRVLMPGCGSSARPTSTTPTKHASTKPNSSQRFLRIATPVSFAADYSISIGMTRADVAAIFGGRANGRSCLFPGPDDDAWEDVNSNDSASIVFDENDRVVAKHWFHMPDDRTVIEKLLDRLPWRERQRPLPERSVVS